MDEHYSGFPALFPLDLKSQDAVKRWWKQREGKSLRELQTEIVQYAITVERKNGFSTVSEEAATLGPAGVRASENDRNGTAASRPSS